MSSTSYDETKLFDCLADLTSCYRRALTVGPLMDNLAAGEKSLEYLKVVIRDFYHQKLKVSDRAAHALGDKSPYWALDVAMLWTQIQQTSSGGEGNIVVGEGVVKQWVKIMKDSEERFEETRRGEKRKADEMAESEGQGAGTDAGGGREEKRQPKKTKGDKEASDKGALSGSQLPPTAPAPRPPTAPAPHPSTAPAPRPPIAPAPRPPTAPAPHPPAAPGRAPSSAKDRPPPAAEGSSKLVAAPKPAAPKPSAPAKIQDGENRKPPNVVLSDNDDTYDPANEGEDEGEDEEDNQEEERVTKKQTNRKGKDHKKEYQASDVVNDPSCNRCQQRSAKCFQVLHGGGSCYPCAKGGKSCEFALNKKQAARQGAANRQVKSETPNPNSERNGSKTKRRSTTTAAVERRLLALEKALQASEDRCSELEHNVQELQGRLDLLDADSVHNGHVLGITTRELRKVQLEHSVGIYLAARDATFAAQQAIRLSAALKEPLVPYPNAIKSCTKCKVTGQLTVRINGQEKTCGPEEIFYTTRMVRFTNSENMEFELEKIVEDDFIPDPEPSTCGSSSGKRSSAGVSRSTSRSRLTSRSQSTSRSRSTSRQCSTSRTRSAIHTGSTSRSRSSSHQPTGSKAPARQNEGKWEADCIDSSPEDAMDVDFGAELDFNMDLFEIPDKDSEGGDEPSATGGPQGGSTPQAAEDTCEGPKEGREAVVDDCEKEGMQKAAAESKSNATAAAGSEESRNDTAARGPEEAEVRIEGKVGEQGDTLVAQGQAAMVELRAESLQEATPANQQKGQSSSVAKAGLHDALQKEGVTVVPQLEAIVPQEAAMKSAPPSEEIVLEPQTGTTIPADAQVGGKAAAPPQQQDNTPGDPKEFTKTQHKQAGFDMDEPLTSPEQTENEGDEDASGHSRRPNATATRKLRSHAASGAASIPAQAKRGGAGGQQGRKKAGK
ncbi:hypothetical protein BJ165DRAFT_1528011 [Panaeolus papilionaceus]|nr:hypothetical protein BJ165DRAFT_1528011 [Panaeolus papilionaceus]